MQRVVIDEPYEFVPPYRGKFVSWAFRYYLKAHLRKTDGVVESDVRGVEKLKASIDAGHGIVLCPNHCRPSDPMAMGLLNGAADCHTFSMASWHVFKQSKVQTFVTRRLGAFSIYREGTDRQALNCAIEILTTAERPLIIFPEGVISRCNDRLGALMDGTAFIARSAAKKRAKEDPNKKVVVHPVALRYQFLGDIEKTVSPILDDIEHRLTWHVDSKSSTVDRIRRIGHALLGLKEIEYSGSTQEGPAYDRLERLLDTILHPMEDEWLGARKEDTVVGRVKNLRSAILPEMISGEITKEERARRWRHLSDMYLAQQLSFYPRGYVDENSPPERILETVERFEEDLTDNVRLHPPLKIIMEVGDAIEVNTKRERGQADPVMAALRTNLLSMLDRLGEEIRQK